MKIAHLTYSFFPNIGGAQVVIHNLALQQLKKNHKVYIISYENVGRYRRWVPYQTLQIPRFISLSRSGSSFHHKFIFYLLIGYWKFIYHFDVLHIHHAMFFYGMNQLKWLGAKIIFTSHGSDIKVIPEIGYGNRLNPGFNAMISKSLRKADACVAINASINKEMLSLKVAESNLFQIKNGVDMNRISNLIINKALIREKYHLDAEKFNIITIGRNHPVKGFELIPGIIAQLIKNNHSFRWYLIGKGNQKIVEMAESNGISEFLIVMDTFEGDKSGAHDLNIPSNDLIMLLKSADCFVFPTRSEGCPLVLLEAMACKIPIVSTEADGVTDLITHRETGLLAKIDNIPAISECIMEIMNDELLREKIRATAYNYILVNHTWEYISDQYLKIYN
jgi:glycosyltransferase involved in cell wall biosynthesis